MANLEMVVNDARGLKKILSSHKMSNGKGKSKFCDIFKDKIMIYTKNEKVYAFSTNLTINLITDITSTVNVNLAGKTVFPLSNFLAMLKNQRDPFTISDDGVAVKIGYWSTPSFAEDDMIRLPEISTWRTITTIANMGQKIGSIAHAAATNHTRLALNSIYFDLLNGQMAATNGEVLATIGVPVANMQELLPISACMKMKKFGETQISGEPILKFGEESGKYKYLSFTCGLNTMFCHTINDVYPAYKGIIDERQCATERLIIQASILKERLSSVVKLAPSEPNQTIFRTKRDCVNISNANCGISVDIPIKQKTADMVIAPNPLNVLNAISSLNGDAVLEFKDNGKPFYIKTGEAINAIAPGKA